MWVTSGGCWLSWGGAEATRAEREEPRQSGVVWALLSGESFARGYIRQNLKYVS